MLGKHCTSELQLRPIILSFDSWPSGPRGSPDNPSLLHLHGKNLLSTCRQNSSNDHQSRQKKKNRKTKSCRIKK